MNITVRGSKIKITKSISDYINVKLSKLDKYFKDSKNANVLVKVHNTNQTIEVTIPINSFILRGEESHKNLYSAIDLVSDKLERQIRKYKTRLNRKPNISLNNNFDKKIDNSDMQKIVRRKTINQKPMCEEEAILQMNLLGHDFFIFNNIDNNKTCVLYRRNDGNFGIITNE